MLGGYLKVINPDEYRPIIEMSYFREKYLEVNRYNEATKNIGLLQYDECFGYVPLLGIGGSEKVA